MGSRTSQKCHSFELLIQSNVTDMNFQKGIQHRFLKTVRFMRIKKCKSDRTAVKFDSSQGNLKHVLHLVSFLPSSQRMLFCTITARL